MMKKRGSNCAEPCVPSRKAYLDLKGKGNKVSQKWLVPDTPNNERRGINKLEFNAILARQTFSLTYAILYTRHLIHHCFYTAHRKPGERAKRARPHFERC